MIDTLAIVGVGLLGGSIALAARERQLARRIIGISRNDATLQIAIQRGMIDAGYQNITDELVEASLCILCIPVDQIASVANTLLQRFPQMIVSDVGSTKATIVRNVNVDASRFIAGHPLAGSEKSGPEHATAELFQNKLMFLCPSSYTSPATNTLATRFWQALGSEVVEMEADRHDAIMAMTSHLPHLASFALASAIPEEYLQYSGSGLRSMTRLAGGDATMWSAIALHNQSQLLSGIHELQQRLHRFEQALKDGDAQQLHQLFLEGRRTYHALGS